MLLSHGASVAVLLLLVCTIVLSIVLAFKVLRKDKDAKEAPIVKEEKEGSDELMTEVAELS